MPRVSLRLQYTGVIASWTDMTCRSAEEQQFHRNCPRTFEDKLEKFQAFIIAEQKKHKYELSLIGNADQTPLTFDMPSNSMVDSKGTKSVSIMTTGHEKDRFTVMLACLGDGTKLPPYVVFKQKTLPKDLVLPRGIHVRAQAKGWMDKSLVKDWLNSIWIKVGGLLRKKKSPCVGLI